MVQFLGKRLQVFVSSTFTDLVPERQAAVEAILTAGHIPAGMELFTSGDESQMDAIKQWIDESDVYMLILGGCYGSVEPKTEKSYTQLEYEYAVAQDKPLFSCVVNDNAQEKRVKRRGTSVTENEHPQKLKAFRSVVESKLVRHWDDAKDIKIAVGETLAQFARRDDLTGWVRPHAEADMPALADEIARLSKENAQLRAALNTSGQDTIAGLQFEELLSLVEDMGIADTLLSNRGAFGRPARSLPGIGLDTVGELCAMGLFTSILLRGTMWYELTDDGRAFLNKLHVASQRVTVDMSHPNE